MGVKQLLGRMLGIKSSGAGSELLEALNAGPSNSAGVNVNLDRARRIATVLACVRVLSEGVGQVPLMLYQRDSAGGKMRVTGNAVYELLHNAPNSFQSSFEFRETLTAHAALTGGGFAWKFYINGGKTLDELVPILPGNVTIRYDANMQVRYDVRLENGRIEKDLTDQQIFHVKGPSWKAYVGDDLVKQAAEALGITAATEIYTGKFFANGASPSVVISYPAMLKPETQQTLKDSLARQYQGAQNAHKLLMLMEGAKLEKIGFSSVDAELNETRRMQAVEICKIFRVPPHMVMHLEKATFSNIEHQSLDFVKFSLTPWLCRWESALQRSVIVPQLGKDFFCEHIVDGLLRGDSTARANYFKTALSAPWMTINEVRSLENLPPLPGGEELRAPLNMEAVTASNPPKDQDNANQA